jgi:hypothetical protein
MHDYLVDAAERVVGADDVRVVRAEPDNITPAVGGAAAVGQD